MVYPIEHYNVENMIKIHHILCDHGKKVSIKCYMKAFFDKNLLKSRLEIKLIDKAKPTRK